jgi:predicted RNase H-like nuclease (RuvC/YqgF family)
MIQEELQKVIEKNLPTEVGKILQDRLLQADEDAKTVKSLSKENEDLKIKNNEIAKEITKLHEERNAVIVQLEVNNRKEKELEKKENELDKKTAEYQLEEVKLRNVQLIDMLKIVFKSPAYKRSYQENNDGTSEYSYDSMGRNTSIPKHIPSSKIITEEIIEE